MFLIMLTTRPAVAQLCHLATRMLLINNAPPHLEHWSTTVDRDVRTTSSLKASDADNFLQELTLHLLRRCCAVAGGHPQVAAVMGHSALPIVYCEQEPCQQLQLPY